PRLHPSRALGVRTEDQAGPAPAVPPLDDERLAGGAVGEPLALPLGHEDPGLVAVRQAPEQPGVAGARPAAGGGAGQVQRCRVRQEGAVPRSEEHTSELQSRFDLVCRLLLEKKNEVNTEVGNKHMASMNIS